MNEIIIIASIIFLIVVGVAIFYFSGKEYVLRFSETQIQEKLYEKLPLTKIYFLIFKVTLDNPRVKLKSGSERVNAGLDVILNIVMGNEELPLGGTIDISAGVAYLSEKCELYLTDPTVESLLVQGIPSKYTDKVNVILSKLIREYYNKHPIYTLNAADLKKATARMILKDVFVENKELVVILGL